MVFPESEHLYTHRESQLEDVFLIFSCWDLGTLSPPPPHSSQGPLSRMNLEFIETGTGVLMPPGKLQGKDSSGKIQTHTIFFLNVINTDRQIKDSEKSDNQVV